MDKPGIAAWILSLATGPDRASATVGDFSEVAPGRWRFGCVTGVALFLSAYVLMLCLITRLSGVWFEVYYGFVPKPLGHTIPAPPGVILVPVIYLITALIATGQCIARVSRRPLAGWALFSVGCTIIGRITALIMRRFPSFS